MTRLHHLICMFVLLGLVCGCTTTEEESTAPGPEDVGDAGHTPEEEYEACPEFAPVKSVVITTSGVPEPTADHQLVAVLTSVTTEETGTSWRFASEDGAEVLVEIPRTLPDTLTEGIEYELELVSEHAGGGEGAPLVYGIVLVTLNDRLLARAGFPDQLIPTMDWCCDDLREDGCRNIRRTAVAGVDLGGIVVQASAFGETQHGNYTLYGLGGFQSSCTMGADCGGGRADVVVLGSEDYADCGGDEIQRVVVDFEADDSQAPNAWDGPYEAEAEVLEASVRNGETWWRFAIQDEAFVVSAKIPVSYPNVIEAGQTFTLRLDGHGGAGEGPVERFDAVTLSDENGLVAYVGAASSAEATAEQWCCTQRNFEDECTNIQRPLNAKYEVGGDSIVVPAGTYVEHGGYGIDGLQGASFTCIDGADCGGGAAHVLVRRLGDL